MNLFSIFIVTTQPYTIKSFSEYEKNENVILNDRKGVKNPYQVSFIFNFLGIPPHASSAQEVGSVGMTPFLDKMT